MTAEHAALRALAEAATPGPWETYMTIHAEAWVCEVDRGGFGAVSLPATGRPDYGLANAAFIAAANPTAVLGLLDEIDQLREGVRAKQAAAWAEGYNSSFADEGTHWLGQRTNPFTIEQQL